MKARIGLSGLLALVLAFAPHATCAQGSIVDTQMEVTTALVQSSITIEAIKKADDARCRELVARIDALTAQVKVGKAQKADLVAAKEALISRIAEEDAGYKAEIDVFRGAVTDIASTPEGAAALARYNAGDEVGALAVLDKLRAAHDAARQERSRIESAVEGRRIAALAYDAWQRGQLQIGLVIERYKEVTTLDPDVEGAWLDLSNLFLATGDLHDAAAAAASATTAAKSDEGRARGLYYQGQILWRSGDRARALQTYAAQVALWRSLSAKQPADQGVQLQLARVLSQKGRGFQEMGQTANATLDDVEAIRVAARAGLLPPGRGPQWTGTLTVVFDTYAKSRELVGDFDLAWAVHETALALGCAGYDRNPNPGARAGIGTALNILAQTDMMRGDLKAAAREYQASMDANAPLAASDPQSQPATRAIAYDIYNLGVIELTLGDFSSAKRDLERALSSFQRFVATDPSDYMDATSSVGAMMVLSVTPGSGRRLSDVAPFAAHLAKGHDLTPYERLIMSKLGEMTSDPSIGPDNGWPFLLKVVADADVATGDTGSAAANLHDSLIAAQRLAARDPQAKGLQALIDSDREALGVIQARAAASIASRQDAGLSGTFSVLSLQATPSLGEALGRPGLEGVVLIDVSGRPWWGAPLPLQVGDVLMTLNGDKIRSVDDLQARLAASKGAAFSLAWLRDNVAVRLSFQPTPPMPATAQSGGERP